MTKIDNIRHDVNPLHVYCRLKEGGMSKPLAMAICRIYEILFYWTLK